MHRIYFFAGDAAFRDKSIGPFVAEERLKTALKYAALCDDQRAYPSFAVDIIKSTLAALYFSTGKTDLAEQFAAESTNGLAKVPLRNSRTLLNNYVILTQIQVAKKNFPKAKELLYTTYQYKRTSGVHTHDKEISALSQEIRKALGEPPRKRPEWTGERVFDAPLRP